MSCGKYPFLGDQSNTFRRLPLSRLCRSEAKSGLDRSQIRVVVRVSNLSPGTDTFTKTWEIVGRSHHDGQT